jgi:hypothetical protein
MVGVLSSLLSRKRFPNDSLSQKVLAEPHPSEQFLPF